MFSKYNYSLVSSVVEAVGYISKCTVEYISKSIQKITLGNSINSHALDFPTFFNVEKTKCIYLFIYLFIFN